MGGIDNKTSRIANNTLMLYIRMLFVMAIGFFTSRVILQSLGVEDYGIYNVVGGFVSLFAVVSSALTGACTRFLNFEMGKGKSDRLGVVFSTTLTVQSSLAIVIVLLTETIGLIYLNNYMVIPSSRLTAANWVFQFSILTFSLDLITVPYTAAIIAHEQMKAFAYVSIIESVIKLLIAYSIMVSPIDKLVFYALLLCVLKILIQSAYRLYCKKHFSECTYHFVVDKILLKQIFSYTGWHLIGNSATVLKNQGVDIILNAFYGPIANAAKGVANQVLSAVSGFAGNFMIALNPQITQSYSRGDRDYMINLVYKGSRFSYYILMIISLPVIIESEYLLNIWLVEVPLYSVSFVQLSLILTLISSLSSPLMTAQNATGQVKIYQIVVGSMMLLNLPLSYLFLKIGYSPVSVLIVAVFVEMACLIARLLIIPHYILEFKFKNYLKKVVLNCFGITLISVIVPLLLFFLLKKTFLTFILVSVSSVCTSSVLIYYIGCDVDERTFVMSKVNEIKNKILGK